PSEKIGRRSLWLWKQESRKSSPEAFIFARNTKGEFMDSGNFRNRVLHRLAGELKLPKLTLQMIRRSIATLAQKKGGVKDVQGMRPSTGVRKADRWASFGRVNVNVAAARRRTAGSSASSRLVHMITMAGTFPVARSSTPRIRAFTPARSSWCICPSSRD